MFMSTYSLVCKLYKSLLIFQLSFSMFQVPSQPHFLSPKIGQCIHIGLFLQELSVFH